MYSESWKILNIGLTVFVVLLESVTVEGGDYEVGVLMAAIRDGWHEWHLFITKRVVRKFTFSFKKLQLETNIWI